eukprot:1161135-Pelagomonas_calceolata.AAC.12
MPGMQLTCLQLQAISWLAHFPSTLLDSLIAQQQLPAPAHWASANWHFPEACSLPSHMLPSLNSLTHPAAAPPPNLCLTSIH